MMFDITRAGAAQSFVKGTSVPQYKLCLEDIDELVSESFRLASRNPTAYLRVLKYEARDFFS